MASMFLVVEDAERCHHESSKACFTLAFRCVPQLRVSWPDPLWLNIESAPIDPALSKRAVDMVLGPARDLTHVFTRAAGISHHPTTYIHSFLYSSLLSLEIHKTQARANQYYNKYKSIVYIVRYTYTTT